MASGSPLSTQIMFLAYEPEHDPTNLAACTFAGHDRDLNACECAHSLRPWKHCPAHRNRVRCFLTVAVPLGGPFWGPNAEADVVAGREALAILAHDDTVLWRPCT